MEENEVDDLALPAENDDFEEGESYLIQTDTLWLFAGQAALVTPTHVTFNNCTWIQEMGRFSAFMAAKGGVATAAEHMGELSLRVAKKHIVFDVQIENLFNASIPQR